MLGDEVQLAVGNEDRLAIEVPCIAWVILLVGKAQRQIGERLHAGDGERVRLVHDIHAQVAARIAVVADIGDVEHAVGQRDCFPIGVRRVLDGMAVPILGRHSAPWRHQHVAGVVDGEQRRLVTAVIVDPVEVAALGLDDAADLAERRMVDAADALDACREHAPQSRADEQHAANGPTQGKTLSRHPTGASLRDGTRRLLPFRQARGLTAFKHPADSGSSPGRRPPSRS